MLIQTILTLMLVAPLALAASDPEPVKPWPDSIRRKIIATADRVAVQLSTALFESLDELKVTVFHFPNYRGTLGVQLHRDVYDNFDLLQTYTVIDRAKIQADLKPFGDFSTWVENVETSGIGTPFVTGIFNPQTSIEWLNVRPVRAYDYVRGEEPVPTPNPDVTEMNPEIPLVLLDPSIRARFKKIPNLLTFPFRLPLSRSDVSKMKDGEILGYAFDGQIEVGLAAGLKIIPNLGVLEAGIQARGTVLLHGRHQISVLRENERYARIKLTRLKERAVAAGIEASFKRYGVYDGLIVFKKNVLAYDFKVIPFQWETSQIRSNQFDVVYRYDLDSSEGKKAFHQAVLGRFAFSDEISEKDTNLETGRRVEQLLSRDGIRRTKGAGMNIDLTGILRLTWNHNTEDLEATLELPDGTHHILQGIRESSKRNRALFSTAKENRSKRMTLLFDQELYANHDPDSVFMITEVTEEDTSTRGKELNSSIARMETFLRKPDLLPTIPNVIPRKNDRPGRKRAWYGRSSTYYGYSLSLKEISIFLQANEASIRERAEIYLSEGEVRRFMEDWLLARQSLISNAEPKRFFGDLKSLFTGKLSIDSLTNIIFDTLVGHPIDYFVTAQNISFGRIQESGKITTSTDRLLTLSDRELGFENYARRLKQDAEALVRGLQMKRLANGNLSLRFFLAQHPENLFFRLARVTGFKKQKIITEFVFNNRTNRFNAGENVLDLDPYSLDLLTAKLSKDLRSGEFYSLSLGFSKAGDRFGPVSSTRFQIEK